MSVHSVASADHLRSHPTRNSGFIMSEGLIISVQTGVRDGETQRRRSAKSGSISRSSGMVTIAYTGGEFVCM